MEKFRLLLPKGASGTPEDITELLERMEINKSSYQIGKTKVSVLTKIILILTQNKSFQRIMCFLSYLGVPQGEGEAAAS